MTNELKTIPFKYTDSAKIMKFCPLTYSTTLASGIEQTLTIPIVSSTNASGSPYDPERPRTFVCINIAGANTASVVITNNATASTVPASFTQSAQELCTVYHEVCKEVKGGDVLHFLSDTANIKINALLYIIN